MFQEHHFITPSDEDLKKERKKDILILTIFQGFFSTHYSLHCSEKFLVNATKSHCQRINKTLKTV